MDRSFGFDLDVALFSLNYKDMWNNPNWTYSGIKDIKPEIPDNLPVSEKNKILSKYHGRFVEWKCKIPEQSWRVVRIVEDSNRCVRIEKNW